jgi:hypothetical protein
MLTRSEPFLSSLFRGGTAGLAESRVVTRGGAAENVSATYLHPLAPADRISAKNTVSVTYAVQVAGLEDLPDSGVWRSAVSVSVEGVEVARGSTTKTYLGTDEAILSDCSYEVWLVEDRLELGSDDGTYFVLHYAAELGVVVASVKMAATGVPVSAVVYDTVSVHVPDKP